MVEGKLAEAVDKSLTAFDRLKEEIVGHPCKHEWLFPRNQDQPIK